MTDITISGTVIIPDSTVGDNRTARRGGGIYNIGGMLTLDTFGVGIARAVVDQTEEKEPLSATHRAGAGYHSLPPLSNDSL